MLKVGIEASGLTAHTGATGLHRYLAGLVTHLAARAEQHNFHLYLYSAHPVPPEARAPVAPLAAAPPGPAVTWRTAPFARGWWRLGMGIAMQLDRLDVFHFPSPHMSTYCPKPAVVTVHDLAALSLEADLTRKERRYLADMSDAIRRATALIAVSQSAADEVARHFDNHSEVSVIREGVDRSRFRAVPDAAGIVREQLGLTDYVLCVGTVQTRKNHVRLVQAFERIQSEVPHTLVIAGRDGSGAEALQTYLDLHPDARVRRLGYVDEALLPALYTAAGALALPSLWEGFGLPVVEAMACGTPVLTSDSSSLIEVAGDAALLANPRDVADIARNLYSLLTDAALRRRLVEAGVRRAEAFSWEQAAAHTVEVYRHVVTRSS